VTHFALRIGTTMGLSEPQLRTLELAGLLHDVGKIGVPEAILRKVGPLNDDEYEIVKRHVEIGEGIVRQIEGAAQIAEIVRHHHERWDGKGYPDGLSGEESSLLARILAVADAYEVMTSEQPYRDRLAETRVLELIEQDAGKQFDPAVVKALLEEREKERRRIPRQGPAKGQAGTSPDKP
jgi:HD-GYP domain-containing protein (c-di-GMP phosphodiesterase class II)